MDKKYRIITALFIGIAFAQFVSFSSLALQFFAISTLALLAIPLILTLQKQSIDIFSPVWLFVFLYVTGYGYKAALIALNPEDFITFPQYFPRDQDFMIYAFILSLLGLAAFYVGYFSKFHNIVMKYLPDLGDKVGPKRIYTITILGLIIGTVSIANSVPMTFSEMDLANIVYSASVRQKFTSQLIGKGFFNFMISLLPVFALVLFHHSLNNRRSILLSAITIFSLAFALLSAGMIGSRLSLLGTIVALITLYHYEVQRIGLFAVLVISMILIWSAGALAIWMAPQDYVLASLYDIIRRLGGSLEFFDHLVTSFSRVENYYWGMTVVEDLIITYLPRPIFPWKPLIYGQVRLQETILPGLYTGESAFGATMAMGILAEGYTNFGLAGVFLLPLLAGIFLRAIYEKAKAESRLYIVIHSYTLGMLFTAIRGFGAFMVTTILIIFLCWLFYKSPFIIPLVQKHKHL